MTKNIRPYLDHYPEIDPSCYIDEMSVVIGDVKLAENVSVWPFAVIRGDVNSIQIGKTVMYRIIACCMSAIRINLNPMVHRW